MTLTKQSVYLRTGGLIMLIGFSGMDRGPENGSANVGLLRISSFHGKAFRRRDGYLR